MDKKTEHWRSPSLGRKMEVAVYGSSGTPILAFPTRGAGNDQWETHGMVDAVSHQLENGYNQLFCIESVDEESFLNTRIEPPKRITRQQQFESYVVEEVVPFIRQQNDIEYLILAGVDMGGYQAVNIALKHPGSFGKAIGMSGVYDIKGFLDSHYDEDVYYSNPVDYIPNLNNRSLLEKIKKVDYRLATYANDSRLTYALRMSDVLRMKFIEHKLDNWDLSSDMEWDLWKRMLKTHII